MNLVETFSTMPNVTGLAGLPQAWQWSYAPGLDSCAALSRDRNYAFETHTRDSFDEGLAVALLSFAREHGTDLITLPEGSLKLVEGFAHPGYNFDSMVAVGPAIHRLYPDDSALNSAVRVVVPAFRCEFTGDEDYADAEYRYSRAAGVSVSKWNRPPRPFLKLRFRGNDGILPTDRDFFRPKLLVSWITRNEDNPDLFIEFENYRRELYTVEWANGWTITTPGSAPTHLTLENLLNTLKTALYGPNITADTVEFPT